jgi:Rps23 Pro-64 3,4-dihydroxylase Tpa1-like proline 4-hydroxylase
VLDLISPPVLQRAAALRDAFQAAQPFRHVVVDEFLTRHYCQQLMGQFPAFDPQHALNEFGQVGRKSVFQQLPKLGPAYERFDRMLRSREFLSFIGEISGIPKLLYDPDYVGGGTHENLEGQELDPHVDFNYHPRTKLHRRLNLILFLNAEWEPQWGGNLELHRNPWLPPEENDIQAIVPVANRCVLFETSEHSWHGFSRIQLPAECKQVSRRSIAVYFYTRQRPACEVAPDHSTVYVQRPLPAHLAPGHTLTEADVGEMRDLLARRDQQLQFLYKRELKFSALLDSIVQSPVYRLAAGATWPARKLWRMINPK